MTKTKKPSDDCIGYLIEGHAVVGRSCCFSLWRPPDSVPIFRSNIGSYRQSCSRCGTVLVEPASPAWPELFDGRCFTAGRPPARERKKEV